MFYIGVYYLKKHIIIFSIIALYTAGVLLRTVGFSVWLPGCPISAITGYHCFGCGLTTAAMQFISGEFNAAFTTNPLFYFYLIGTIVFIGFDFFKFTLTQKQHMPCIK